MIIAKVAMDTRLSLCAVMALAPLASACAEASDRYPSLAIRDVERIEGTITPVAPDPEPVAPVASPQDIAALIEQAQASHARFSEALPGARSLIAAASGAGIDSNSRQRALVALADLTSLRSDTARALGSLDGLEAEARTTFAPAASIARAQADIANFIAEEDKALDDLAARLGL